MLLLDSDASDNDSDNEQELDKDKTGTSHGLSFFPLSLWQLSFFFRQEAQESYIGLPSRGFDIVLKTEPYFALPM